MSNLTWRVTIVYPIYFTEDAPSRLVLLVMAFAPSPNSPDILTSGLYFWSLVHNAWLHFIPETAGMPGNYLSHSFHIGAATSAAVTGTSDHVVKTLGRWSNDCYLRNIRLLIGSPSCWDLFRGWERFWTGIVSRIPFSSCTLGWCSIV